MTVVSDVINDHTITVRYGVGATIVLLSASSIAHTHTPLFYRFRTARDIPAEHLLRRTTLRGRLLHAETTPKLYYQHQQQHQQSSMVIDGEEKPVVCYVRHLSPTGRLLSRPWFDWFVRASPSAAVIPNKLEDNDDE